MYTKQCASIHPFSDSFLHSCTGGRSHRHWLYALYITDLQICVWLSPWWCLLVHSRHRLDNWSLLHHVRPVSQRRHQRAGKKYNAEYLLAQTCNIQHSVYCHFQIYKVDLISDERVWMRVMWCSLKVCRCILMWPDCGRSLRSTESLSSTPHPLL